MSAGSDSVHDQSMCSNSDEEQDELNDYDQQLHEEASSDQQVSGDKGSGSGGLICLIPISLMINFQTVRRILKRNCFPTKVVFQTIDDCSVMDPGHSIM